MTAPPAPVTKPPLTRRTGPSRRARSAALGYALLAPSLFGVVVFLLVPIVVVVWLSFQRWDLIGSPQFAGLSNWVSVFTAPGFGRSLLVTIVFTVLVVALQIVLGILVAVLLTRGLRGSGIFRVVFVIPWVCAPLALGVVWNVIFQPTGGALNTILGTHIAWLTSPVLALAAVIGVSVWSQVGYVSLFFMAGLAVIPDTVVEAARVDGADAARIFWSITLPLLRPTMFFVLVTSIVTAVQTFDTIYSLTQGGPMNATDVLAFSIYQQAFTTFNLGQAAVTAIVLFVMLIIVTLAQQLYFRKRITYDLS
jgi:multiple sugar transport system permease protein